MSRFAQLAAGTLLLGTVAGSAGCALELLPTSQAPVAARHAEPQSWASEPSSRWTISIQPDTDEEPADTTETAAVPPPVAKPSSEPLAPAPKPVLTAAAAPLRVEPEPPSVAAPAPALPTYVSPRATSVAEPDRALSDDSSSDDASRHDDAGDTRVAELVAPAVPAAAAVTPPQVAQRATPPAPAPYVIEPPQRGGGEPRDPADSSADDLLDPEYRIGVEDLLDVSLLGEPDLQHVAMRVSPRGTVDFPYAGTLTAAGLSVDEFRGALLEKLDDYFVVPQVTVFLREYRSRMVHILGEVPRPGPFKLTHRNTLMEVLSRAGGFTPLANKSDVQIIRQDAAGKRIIRVDVTEIIDDGRIDLDIPLESGDVINVPERLF